MSTFPVTFRRHPWGVGADVTIHAREPDDQRDVYDFLHSPGPSARTQVASNRTITFENLQPGVTYIASGHGGILEFTARDPEPRARFWDPNGGEPPPAPQVRSLGTSRLRQVQDVHKH